MLSENLARYYFSFVFDYVITILQFQEFSDVFSPNIRWYLRAQITDSIFILLTFEISQSHLADIKFGCT